MKTFKEFYRFVEENIPGIIRDVISPEEIETVAHNLMRLQKHYAGENQMFGSFMNCIANKDFYNALAHADSLNQVMIKVYAAYIYNFAPIKIQ